MQEKDESLMAQKKLSDGKKEEISQVHILKTWVCEIALKKFLIKR